MPGIEKNLEHVTRSERHRRHWHESEGPAQVLSNLVLVRTNEIAPNHPSFFQRLLFILTQTMDTSKIKLIKS